MTGFHSKKASKKAPLLLVLCLILSSCMQKSFIKLGGESLKPADSFMGLKRELVQGDDFIFTTYQRVQNPNAPYVFYLEGDGSVWDYRKNRVSEDPTPQMLTMLKLAAIDDRPNVVYVARPCQYTPMSMNPRCSNLYWTDKRFSEDSIAAMNSVINKINGARHKFTLIGFSGGGGLAVLIAARNPMVGEIITIAANLDIVSFTKHHRSNPMSQSLNPIDYAKQVNKVPQLHLSGARDRTVPPFIAEEFVKVADSRCVKNMIIPKASHHKGWGQLWKEGAYKQPVNCE